MKRATTLRCSKTQVLLKRINAHQEVFPKKGAMNIQISHNELYKI